jgi:predicted RNA-binding protein with PUA domain
MKKGKLVRRHIANIEKASVVLVANFDKNGIENYIGGNVLLEMGAGFVFEKPIYLLNPIPGQDNYEEILALEPIVIDGDLSRIEVKR